MLIIVFRFGIHNIDKINDRNSNKLRRRLILYNKILFAFALNIYNIADSIIFRVKFKYSHMRLPRILNPIYLVIDIDKNICMSIIDLTIFLNISVEESLELKLSKKSNHVIYIVVADSSIVLLKV